jgi:DEAD/DEAH box helicase domain-containing protein
MWRNFFRSKRFGVGEYLKWLRRQDGDIGLFHSIKPKDASYGSFGSLDPEIINSLKNKGIERLYSHQSQAFSMASAGKDIVVVTPTASGKTLCYDLPVLNSIVKDPCGRAMYLFPTKALAQDQLTEINELSRSLKGQIKSFTYDGDTPRSKRKEIKTGASIVITNPDMLNTAILPHHTSWAGYFRNLNFIVVDELHTYRGVLGSHLANIFVRLLRICRHYGSDPVFICCSATIANPREHAELLTGKPAVLINENGAPSAEKKLVIYNPRMINRQRGIRRSSLYEAGRLAHKALSFGISSILFTGSRTNVELLLKSLKQQLLKDGKDPGSVRGYRSGYLPAERRETEKNLRNGKLKAVVSTNALELGIDIGSLDLALIHGFPGSIASVWQQVGRAGRRNSISAAVIIPSGLSIDQFLAGNPGWLLGASPETARIDPLNPYIMLEHIKCAVFELPFRANETFGGQNITDILEFLSAHGMLGAFGNSDTRTYSWNSDNYPAASFSIRSASGEKYDIYDVTSKQKPMLIGTMDKHSASALIFPGAVYFHNGESYSVREIDSENKRCFVERSLSQTFTEAKVHVRTNIVRCEEGRGLFAWGETKVSASAGMYKVIDISTRKTVGHGTVDLPEDRIDTTSLWITMPEKARSRPGLLPAMNGLANLLKNLAPLFLMCDSSDIYVSTALSEPTLKQPALFLSDAIPGGVGLAEGAYDSIRSILMACREQLDSCRCSDGCPSCIGTVNSGIKAKDLTGKLLDDILCT